MDSDDAEGAELPPVDAKNIAGAGTKRRVERAHDPSRHTIRRRRPGRPRELKNDVYTNKLRK